MLRRDVIAVRAESAEVGRARADELDPPVRQIRWNLNADSGHQPTSLGHEPLHVLDRHLARPAGSGALWSLPHARAPVPAGRLVGDLRRLLAVVALVWEEVLEDH